MKFFPIHLAYTAAEMDTLLGKGTKKKTSVVCRVRRSTNNYGYRTKHLRITAENLILCKRSM